MKRKLTTALLSSLLLLATCSTAMAHKTFTEEHDEPLYYQQMSPRGRIFVQEFHPKHDPNTLCVTTLRNNNIAVSCFIMSLEGKQQ